MCGCRRAAHLRRWPSQHLDSRAVWAGGRWDTDVVDTGGAEHLTAAAALAPSTCADWGLGTLEATARALSRSMAEVDQSVRTEGVGDARLSAVHQADGAAR